jgi:MGT family glycosyltransferase
LGIHVISTFCTFETNDRVNYLSVLLNRSILDKLRSRAEFVYSAKYLLQKYGIRVPNLYSLHTLKADINLVYTSRYFQTDGENFDESYKFIGPSMTQTRKIQDQFLVDKEKSKLIFISLGTIFNKSIDFYESCFMAFSNMNVKVIMSIGESIALNTFQRIPSNFIVRNYVPQLEILKQTDLFITHGGMNSTNEGLYYSVPLIIIPHFFDQPAVAARVAELGAGIVIDKDKVTSKLLKNSVNQIFSNITFKSKSEIIGKSLRDAGGYKRGAAEIFNFKNNKGLLWNEREIS